MACSDVGGIDPGMGQPGAGAQARFQAAVDIVGQPLLDADAGAQAAHHAKDAQDCVGQARLYKVGVVARQAWPAKHDIRLGLAFNGH